MPIIFEPYSGGFPATSEVYAVAPRARAEIGKSGGRRILAVSPRASMDLTGGGSGIPVPEVELLYATAPSARASISGRMLPVLRGAAPHASALFTEWRNGVQATAPRSYATIHQAGDDGPFMVLYTSDEPYLSMWMGSYGIQGDDGLRFVETVSISASTGARDTIVLSGDGRTVLGAERHSSDAVLFPDILRLIWFTAASDQLGLDGDHSMWKMVVAAVRDAIRLSGAAKTGASITMSRDDVVRLSGAIYETMRVAASDTIGLASTASSWRKVLWQASDQLVLSGACSDRLEALLSMASAIAFDEEFKQFFAVSADDTIDLRGDFAGYVVAIAAVLDTMQFSGTSDMWFSFAVAGEDDIEFSDSPATSLLARLLGGDTLALSGRLVINGDSYSCWVINTESKGLSRWSNYPFNSFAQMPGGQWVGATDTGLHLLGGDSDAGEPITARIRTALTDLGSRHMKRVPSMYLGYSSDGRLGLKVIVTSETGEKSEDHYLLEQRPAGDVRESRFKIGRGIKSMYVGYEIVTVDGGDFSLDVVEWMPLQLDRRLT